jgi:uncharacterized membrane protein (UPF0182 family)
VRTAPPRPPILATLRRLLPLAIAIVALAVLYGAINLFVSLYTTSLWFDSLHDASVFDRRLLTQLVMFAVFGGATALAVAVNLTLLHRHTPYDGGRSGRFAVRQRYGRWIYPRRHLLTAVITVIAGLQVGLAAARRWQLWLQWRNATSFGIKDPQFHRDFSYYAFVYPMHRYALTVAFTIVVLSLVLLGAFGYLNGGYRPRGERPRLRAEMRVHLCLLLGVLSLLKAAAYWLDRLGTAVSNRGVVTGPSFTDIHAVLPSKLVLLVIAVVLAVLFFVNAAFRSWKATAAGVLGLAVSGVVLGGVVPWLVQQYHVKPDAQDAEATAIARNIAATRYAYGIGAGTVTSSQPTAAASTLSPKQERAVVVAAQPQVLDPNQVSPTFTQLQQLRAYYGFKSTLDTDRYDINGAAQDVVLAVRELTLGGLPSGQQTWSNQHLVYTHGYGVVAAPVDTVNSDGAPTFAEQGAPPSGALGNFEPRIYFGQMSPSYSIVGAPPGARPHELDRPSSGARQVDTTYRGDGGVSVGSFFRRLVYSWRFRDKNILFSKGVNSRSRLLYVRDPRQRVRQVAPWLTPDGAAYPVVADGRVLWVVDGYTTSNSLPYSQQQNLRSAASDSYVTNGSSAAQAGSINYIRDSVKATVDAYDGTVTLYEWDTETGQPDPVLHTWMKAFPGLVKPASDIPADVLPHLRYPRDLFNVQRTLLTRYHVTDPRAFYNGSDFWRIPSDPTVQGSTSQPPYYLRLPTSDGTELSLTTPFVSLNGRAMTAFLTVGSDPGPGYGQMSLQTLPAGVEGPGQIRNDIESDPTVAQQLTLLRGGGSRVVLGNLQPVPMNGSVVWVEPIYSRAAGGTSFPILRRVVVVHDNTIAFEPSLDSALADAFGGGASPSARLAAAIATAQQAQARAQAALTAGDRAEYQRQERRLANALAEIAAAGAG